LNLLLLVGALLPWAANWTAALSLIFLAISVLSVEMQMVTLLGVGTLRSLTTVNLALAVITVTWQARRERAFAAWGVLGRVPLPWAVLLPLGGLVLILNVALPLEAADPYHLDRAVQIGRLGTLEYDPTADPKINIVGWVYELLLADARQVPWIGATLVQLHGVFGFLLYGVAVASVRTSFLPGTSTGTSTGASTWPWAVLFVAPALFHQFVLLKNDLFLAVPALVALAWLVTSASRASWRDCAWAGWLAGFAVAGKIVGFSLALVMVVGVLVARRGVDWRRPLGGLAAGGFLGGLTGGLFFTWGQNLRWYGDLLANEVVAQLGNMSTSAGESLLSVWRLGLSLFDMGQLTTALWPGRGGWGSTLGLPFIWAVAVLVWRYRSAREARWALWSAAGCLVGFAAVYSDADLMQRLVLAPGLLVIATAVHLLDRDRMPTRWARVALVPVLVLSAAQILRSAVLYFSR
jgi:hypothetical protein